jgi:hypothetical protein
MTAKVLGLRLSYLRPALYAIVALDVIALALFAVRVDTVTKTTTTPTAQVVSTAPALPATDPVPLPPLLPPAPPLLVVGGGTPVTVPVDEPTKAPPTPPTTPAEPQPTPGGPSARIARCPIPINEPTTSGGLQSLISLAPAFGPFKDEAFAAASAYQPLLQLLGPILAKYPEIAPKLEPAMTPFIQAFGGLLDQGFALISPFYSPHRQAVLEAEGKLAAALAPFTQALASSPLGGCVVELQAALLEDSTAEKG